MLAPFQAFLYPKLKLSDFLRDLNRSIAQSILGRDSRKFFDPPEAYRWFSQTLMRQYPSTSAGNKSLNRV